MYVCCLHLEADYNCNIAALCVLTSTNLKLEKPLSCIAVCAVQDACAKLAATSLFFKAMLNDLTAVLTCLFVLFAFKLYFYWRNQHQADGTQGTAICASNCTPCFFLCYVCVCVCTQRSTVKHTSEGTSECTTATSLRFLFYFFFNSG